FGRSWRRLDETEIFPRSEPPPLPASSDIILPKDGISSPAIGTFAIILGFASAAVPYFAAVFLVPIAFACALIALARRQVLAGLVGGIFAFFGAANIADTSKKLEAIFGGGAFPEKSSAPTVTASKYDQVRAGMSYEQVRGIVGEPGNELSRSELL